MSTQTDTVQSHTMQLDIVFCDLDFTFLTSKGDFLEKNMEALNALFERHIAFVPCTGRGLRAIPERLLEHPACNYAVCASGASLYEVKNRSIIWSCSIDKSDVRALYEELKSLNISFDVFADGHIYAERFRYEKLDSFGLAPEKLAFLMRVREPQDCSAAELLSKTSVIERVGCFWPDSEEGRADALKIRSAVERHPSLRLTSSQHQAVEILNASASKGSAIEQLCKVLGVPREHTLAFGDSLNDLEMFEAAGRGIAVENACDELKARASDICPSCDDAGVACYLEKFLQLT